MRNVISGPRRGKSVEGEMLIDTGATYTRLPPSMAKDLGLPFIAEVEVEMAEEGEGHLERRLLEINGREDMEVRIFEVAEPVIGCSTLEGLGLSIDPVSGELKLTSGFHRQSVI